MAPIDVVHCQTSVASSIEDHAARGRIVPTARYRPRHRAGLSVAQGGHIRHYRLVAESKDDAWRWEDAWVLQAVCLATSSGTAPADLQAVMGAGDAVNHAVFTFDELSAGLRKLTAADIVTVRGDAIALTEQGRELCARGTGNGLHEQTRQIHVWLSRLPAPTGESVLSTSIYQRTLDAYLGRS